LGGAAVYRCDSWPALNAALAAEVRALTLFLVLLSVAATAQTTAPPSASPIQTAHDPATQSSPSDLAAAAERARQEREQQRTKRSANSEAVNEMATELADSAEQAILAPAGYRSYNFQPGDYSVLVPAEAEVEGRNWYGLKLLSSEGMGSRTVVILGNPIPTEATSPKKSWPMQRARTY